LGWTLESPKKVKPKAVEPSFHNRMKKSWKGPCSSQGRTHTHTRQLLTVFGDLEQPFQQLYQNLFRKLVRDAFLVF